MKKRGNNRKNSKRNSKGLSTVITTLILIALVLVALGIVWVVVKNVLKKGSDEISLTSLTLDLEISKASVEEGELNVTVKRNPGKGRLVGINFVIGNDEDTTTVFKETTLNELGMDTFTFALNNLPINDITKISIAPVFELSSGAAAKGEIVDTEEYPISIGSGGGSGGGSTPAPTADCVGKECGSDGIGGSCGKCETDERCDDGICAAACDLISATWNMANTIEGEPVEMTISGENCNGEIITLQIYEDDAFINPDDPVLTNPLDIFFDEEYICGLCINSLDYDYYWCSSENICIEYVSGEAPICDSNDFVNSTYGICPTDKPIFDFYILIWTTEFQDDEGSGQSNPPEYYFKVDVLGTSETIKSSLLTVNALPTCNDGIWNGDETGVDCGGSVCDACVIAPFCDDGACNGDETCLTCEADCGCEDNELCNPRGECVANCVLTSKFWSVSDAVEGDQVQLTVTGTDCDGQTISFEVLEYDIFSGDDSVLSTLSNIVMTSGQATTNWNAEWQDEELIEVGTNNRYYFIPTVVSSGKSLTDKNPKLSVTQAIGCGDGACNGDETCSTCAEDCGCLEGYECSSGECVASCILTDKFWSVSDAVEGDQVQLTVTGTNCDGETVSFRTWEYDLLSQDTLSNYPPASAVMDSGQATTNWIAEYSGGFLEGDDEYYFIPSISSLEISLTDKSPRLKVSPSDFCGNGVCEHSLQEDCATCIEDCGCSENEECTFGICWPLCELTSASWNVNSASVGEPVELQITGANCGGKQISFEIWEKDGFLNSPDSLLDYGLSNPSPIIFPYIGTTAFSVWYSAYVKDTDGLQSPPPEYYFVAKVVGEDREIESPNNGDDDVGLLTVTQAIGCGDGACNNGETCLTCVEDCGCASGEDCDSSGTCVGECSLKMKYWNTDYAIEGQIVKLIVTGENCDGQTISFDIKARDEEGDEMNIISAPMPSSIVMEDGLAEVTWRTSLAEISSIFGDTQGEYYFIPTIYELGLSLPGAYPFLLVYKGELDDCGDNICQNTETCASCNIDCGKCPYCRDGACNNGETCSTCVEDCGCGEGEECSFGACIALCDLTSASWSTTSAFVGDIVRLNVQGTNCKGKEIFFEVFEKDGFEISSTPIAPTQTITYGAPFNYAFWETTYVDDTEGIQSNPPEYYFVATVVGEDEEISSPNNGDNDPGLLIVDYCEDASCSSRETCEDHIYNNGEELTDCGGPNCKPCTCNYHYECPGTDCIKGYCLECGPAYSGLAGTSYSNFPWTNGRCTFAQWPASHVGFPSGWNCYYAHDTAYDSSSGIHYDYCNYRDGLPCMAQHSYGDFKVEGICLESEGGCFAGEVAGRDGIYYGTCDEAEGPREKNYLYCDPDLSSPLGVYNPEGVCECGICQTYLEAGVSNNCENNFENLDLELIKQLILEKINWERTYTKQTDTTPGTGNVHITTYVTFPNYGWHAVWNVYNFTSFDSQLSEIARLHSQDMADNNYMIYSPIRMGESYPLWGPRNSDGLTADQRIAAAGYEGCEYADVFEIYDRIYVWEGMDEYDVAYYLTKGLANSVYWQQQGVYPWFGNQYMWDNGGPRKMVDEFYEIYGDLFWYGIATSYRTDTIGIGIARDDDGQMYITVTMCDNQENTHDTRYPLNEDPRCGYDPRIEWCDGAYNNDIRCYLGYDVYC